MGLCTGYSQLEDIQLPTSSSAWIRDRKGEIVFIKSLEMCCSERLQMSMFMAGGVTRNWLFSPSYIFFILLFYSFFNENGDKNQHNLSYTQS